MALAILIFLFLLHAPACGVQRLPIGGWKLVSNDGELHISVKLDDPSFNAPINAALRPAPNERDNILVWYRPKRDA